jgi:hypothetical protein
MTSLSVGLSDGGIYSQSLDSTWYQETGIAFVSLEKFEVEFKHTD